MPAAPADATASETDSATDGGEPMATFCGREPSLAPPTCGPNWTRTTLLWAVLVVVTGATFFFMLVGWTTIRSVSLRHKVYNLSIQLLNVEFTYMCAILLPERCVLLRGLVKYRSVGVDAFGAPTEAIFHHLPYGQKVALVGLGLVNSLAQLANQRVGRRLLLLPGAPVGRRGHAGRTGTRASSTSRGPPRTRGRACSGRTSFFF